MTAETNQKVMTKEETDLGLEKKIVTEGDPILEIKALGDIGQGHEAKIAPLHATNQDQEAVIVFVVEVERPGLKNPRHLTLNPVQFMTLKSKISLVLVALLLWRVSAANAKVSFISLSFGRKDV
jgi:hypothetical protein